MLFALNLCQRSEKWSQNFITWQSHTRSCTESHVLNERLSVHKVCNSFKITYRIKVNKKTHQSVTVQSCLNYTVKHFFIRFTKVTNIQFQQQFTEHISLWKHFTVAQKRSFLQDYIFL